MLAALMPLINSQARDSGAAIWAGLIAVYLVWGSTYLAILFVVETMPPFLAASFRFLIAGAALYGFTRLRGAGAPVKLEWRSAVIVGFFLLVGGNGGVMWAGKRQSPCKCRIAEADIQLCVAHSRFRPKAAVRCNACERPLPTDSVEKVAVAGALAR